MSRSFFVILLLGVSKGHLQLEETENSDILNLIHLAEDVTRLLPRNPDSNEVDFYLINRTIEAATPLDSHHQDIDKAKPVKILIHGWIEDHKVEWYQDIADEYLKLDDYNIIMTDWGKIARFNYLDSATNAKKIGDHVGQLILDEDLPLTHVHIIGHSLGAHIAGFAGKYILTNKKQKISRITALDPAGPHFVSPLITKGDRLDADDATIVDVIHTDGKFYGYYAPIGTLDIYFNSGRRIQPECLSVKNLDRLEDVLKKTFCSHAQSHEYFAKSIWNSSLVCNRCASWIDFELNRCNGGQYVIKHQKITSEMTGICQVITYAQ